MQEDSLARLCVTESICIMPTQTLTRTSSEISWQPTKPPLEAGDHLSRSEFQRRYATHPEIKKAELIKGVVYVSQIVINKNHPSPHGAFQMASPVRIRQHSIPHRHLITWTGVYEAQTPHVFGGDNGSVILDAADTEVQPDVFLALDAAVGGQSIINVEDYLEGAPELVIEVAASSASYDMHTKKQIYARYGVQEYIVAQVYERQLIWYQLRDSQYEALPPEAHGLLKSNVFPGLWLDPVAFWAGDLSKMLQGLQMGLASTDHADFVARLSGVLP